MHLTGVHSMPVSHRPVSLNLTGVDIMDVNLIGVPVNIGV